MWVSASPSVSPGPRWTSRHPMTRRSVSTLAAFTSAAASGCDSEGDLDALTPLVHLGDRRRGRPVGDTPFRTARTGRRGPVRAAPPEHRGAHVDAGSSETD